MIDHLLTFANEQAAAGVLQSLGFATVDGQDIIWDTSRVVPNMKLTTAEAVWDLSDPQNPVLVTPEETISGFHISIALPIASDALETIPASALRVLENRGEANKNKQFHEYAVSFKSLPEGVASDTPPGQLKRDPNGDINELTYRISPRFLGSDYPDPL